MAPRGLLHRFHHRGHGHRHHDVEYHGYGRMHNHCHELGKISKHQHHHGHNHLHRCRSPELKGCQGPRDGRFCWLRFEREGRHRGRHHENGRVQKHRDCHKWRGVDRNELLRIVEEFFKERSKEKQNTKPERACSAPPSLHCDEISGVKSPSEGQSLIQILFVQKYRFEVNFLQ